MSWTDPPEITYPTPKPCPQCGRKRYKTAKLQRQWAESGLALCLTCQRGWHAPPHRHTATVRCPVCGKPNRTAETCKKCRDKGFEATTLWEMTDR